MAGNFLRRWFGKSASPSTEEARAELDRLAAERPALAPLARWLGEILPELEPDPAVSVSLSPQEAEARLTAGVPLLRGMALPLEARPFAKRWRRVCDALTASGVEGGAALAEAVRRGSLDAREMVEAVLAGEPGRTRERAGALGLSPDLTLTVLRYVLIPTFTALERQLAPLRERWPWPHGHCPTCGAWPLLGEYRGLEQSRFLRCGLCAAGWGADRGWCPFCGTRDHELLHFLHAEGEELRYKAAVCDGCRCYVKMVSTLTALPPMSLPIADLTTLHLDLAAAQRGYVNQA